MHSSDCAPEVTPSRRDEFVPTSNIPERCLAAILIADVAGYSRLMERDEYGTHARLRAVRSEIIQPSLARHGGRIVRIAGDGLLVLFLSAAAALRFAIETQKALFDKNKSTPEGDCVRFRIGINFADILIDESDIAGCGVNVAARLEAIADPGGICVSQAFKRQVIESVDVDYVDKGFCRMKNIKRPVHVFKVVMSRQSTLTRVRAHLDRIVRMPLLRWGFSVPMLFAVGSAAWFQSIDELREAWPGPAMEAAMGAVIVSSLPESSVVMAYTRDRYPGPRLQNGSYRTVARQ